MKKIHWILCAAFASAAIGGILAFKVSHTAGVRVCYTYGVFGNPRFVTSCPLTLLNSTQMPAAFTTYYGTTLLQEDERTCPDIDECYPLKIVSE